ncbi:MAG: helix-turn-helix domain-containing protein [Thermodesulfobacteriota bacterium]
MWALLLRVGAILGVCEVIKRILDETTRDIKPTRLYEVSEAARLLGISHAEVRQLIAEGRIKARQTGGVCKMAGQSLLDYLQS